MKVCLHCGYEVPDDRMRACPRCGQLLPAEEPAVAQSRYVSGDLLKQRSRAQDVHPYLWGVESATHDEAVQLGRRDGVGGALLVVALLLVLAVGTLGVLYATGNAPWMPILPHRPTPAVTHPAG